MEIDLFEHIEYSKDLPQGLDRNKLQNFLLTLWKDRNRFIPAEKLRENTQNHTQRFIDFGSNKFIKPKNWIGSINFRNKNENYTFNLLPKIFYIENHNYSREEKNSIYAHILWWLSGSEKQNYSSLQNSLDAIESNFLEVMMYMFSANTLDVFSVNAYQFYNVVEEELETVRGTIDFNSYAKNYSIGNRQKLPCTYDSFQYDNQFNRIVKYVAILLKDFTAQSETRKNLDELLFILNEVEYTPVTAEDCDKIILNPIYTEFKTVLDNCRLFLSSLSVYKWKDEFDVFALLIPSEKLFENFIFSVLNKNKISPITKVNRVRPNNRTYLARRLPEIIPDRFKMINDIVVGFEDDCHILIDTKYKIIYNEWEDNEDESLEMIDVKKTDANYNISQSDIYQMVSYAVGSGIPGIGLFYPKTIEDKNEEKIPAFGIDDQFTKNTLIRIHPFKVDIIHKEGLGLNVKGKLENLFRETEKKLSQQLINHVMEIKNYIS